MSVCILLNVTCLVVLSVSLEATLDAAKAAGIDIGKPT